MLEHGTSTVWDDLLATGDVADAAFRQAVDQVGMRAIFDLGCRHTLPTLAPAASPFVRSWRTYASLSCSASNKIDACLKRIGCNAVDKIPKLESSAEFGADLSMSIFAYARSGSVSVDLAVQRASLNKAGYLDIAVDRTHSRHPRDLVRRAALLERLASSDALIVYSLDCLAIHTADLVKTIARIRSRKATVLTTRAPSRSNLCNDTLDAIALADATFAKLALEPSNVAPRGPGRYAILGPADWPQVQKDCSVMSMTAVAKHYKVSRSSLYNYIRRMRQLNDIETDEKSSLHQCQNL